MAYDGRITSFLGQGLAADRPASLTIHPDAIGFYRATDTNEASIWAEGAWIEDVLAAGVTAALAGKADKALTVETVAGTTYAFIAADSGKHKRFTNAAAIAATVAHGVHAVGERVRITAAGDGQITLTPGSNVQLNSRGGALKSAGKYAVLEIECVATGTTDEFDVLGDVTT